MNLFFKKLTGKLLSTEKFEQRMSDAAAAMQRYREVEKSNDWKEYKMLHDFVTSAAFVERKNLLIKTKYKTTKYYQLSEELRCLKKNKKLQAFLAVRNSTILKDYLFFRNSPDYVKLSDKTLVKASDDLKRWLVFEKSREYKAYMRLKDSTLPARYVELLKLTADEKFQQENIFWENPKRWVTTDEYKHEMRYKQLAESPDIQFFLKQDVHQIERMERYHCTFADEFDWKRLSDSAWKAGFSYKNKALKRNHSFVYEQQANNDGKNTGTINGTLNLLTREETTIASAWDEKKGFVNKEYRYTADVITTADAFRQKSGLFMAKIRCEGAVNHVAWMGCDTKLPLVKLFHHTGKKTLVGCATANGFVGEKVSGISKEDYYIYSILWQDNTLIWYVNNLEVYRTSANVPQEALYLAFSSFISAGQKPGEGKIEADWVRCYTIDK